MAILAPSRVCGERDVNHAEAMEQLSRQADSILSRLEAELQKRVKNAAMAEQNADKLERTLQELKVRTI